MNGVSPPLSDSLAAAAAPQSNFADFLLQVVAAAVVVAACRSAIDLAAVVPADIGAGTGTTCGCKAGTVAPMVLAVSKRTNQATSERAK